MGEGETGIGFPKQRDTVLGGKTVLNMELKKTEKDLAFFEIPPLYWNVTN